MRTYANDLLILIGFVAATVGMYFLEPALIVVWVGLLIMVIGLFRMSGD